MGYRKLDLIVKPCMTIRTAYKSGLHGIYCKLSAQLCTLINHNSQATSNTKQLNSTYCSPFLLLRHRILLEARKSWEVAQHTQMQ